VATGYAGEAGNYLGGAGERGYGKEGSYCLRRRRRRLRAKGKDQIIQKAQRGWESVSWKRLTIMSLTTVLWCVSGGERGQKKKSPPSKRQVAEMPWQLTKLRWKGDAPRDTTCWVPSLNKKHKKGVPGEKEVLAKGDHKTGGSDSHKNFSFQDKGFRGVEKTGVKKISAGIENSHTTREE